MLVAEVLDENKHSRGTDAFAYFVNECVCACVCSSVGHVYLLRELE